MRIAIISYEMPPETGGGGIGTYLTNLIPMLVGAGHDVEVFAGAGDGAEGTREVYGAALHRFGRDIIVFLSQLGGRVRARHDEQRFDVAEAPEYLAQSVPVRREIPDLPVVVKLHTPSYVIDRLNFAPFSMRMRARWVLGALRRLQWPRPMPSLPRYDASADPEALATLAADQISPPTRAIWELLDREWRMPPESRFDVPYPFTADPRLLTLPINRETKTILWLGRLEGRKGIVEFVNVLPGLLSVRPDVRVRFVGRPHPAPDGRGTFSDWVRRRLQRYESQIELPGAVSPQQLPDVFGRADVAVFPSRWENHPNVCLEAMAAGCGVVGSRHGGMAELLDGGACGALVDPFSPTDLANGIASLLDDGGLRRQLAGRARERVLSVYAPGNLLPRYEEGYRLAIQRHANRGKNRERREIHSALAASGEGTRA